VRQRVAQGESAGPGTPQASMPQACVAGDRVLELRAGDS